MTVSPEFVPPGFVPRGPVWPARRWQQFLLSVLLVDLLFPIRCEKFEGKISRLERRDLPKSWKRDQGNTAAMGIWAPTRYALIWLEETGDMLVGYANAQILHKTRVGDEVALWVKPYSGSVRRLRNRTRPRRWWQF